MTRRPAIKRTPELVARAEQLKAAGLGWYRIGIELGTDYHTVRGWLDPEYAAARLRRFVPSRLPPGPKRTPELVEKAKALRDGGAPSLAIAWHLGVNYETVRCWLDPEYAAHRRARINLNRQHRKAAVRAAKSEALMGLYSLYEAKP